MRIGVVTPWPIDDPQAWSGVVAPMVSALAERTEVVPFVTREVPDSIVDRVLARALDGRFGRRYLVGHALATSAKRGRSLLKRLKEDPVDVILAVAASQDIAFLDTDVPIVQVSDTTYRAIKDFYPLFSNLTALTDLQASIQARRAARRTRHFLAATAWARDALVRDDHVNPRDITVAPFGPAVSPPASPRVEEGHSLRILAVISDWERKGGADVIAVGEGLRRRGVDFGLTVVGDTPTLPDWVTARGRLTPTEMRDAYATADVLIEMARSNAAGVVLTDAAAFGLPVVATDSGGVASIVDEGVTGFLVPTGDVDRAVEKLVALTDEQLLHRLSIAAVQRSADLLSWRRWAAAAATVFELVARPNSADRPAVVSLSPAIPYPGMEHAGGQYLRRLRDALAPSTRLTWLVQDRPSVRHAFRQPGVVEDTLLLADQSSKDRWLRWTYSLADRIEAQARRIDPQPAPLGALIDLLTRPSVRRAIRSADVLDFQWSAWTRLAPMARWLNPDARRVMTFHDVMSQKCEREVARATDPLRRLKWTISLWLSKRWERKALSIADTVLVFSEKDRDLLDPNHLHNVLVVNPPLADGVMPKHSPPTHNRVLLVGFMARPENLEALTWFLKEVWPHVRARVTNAELHVVGKAMPHDVSERVAPTPGVVLRGFVDDLSAEYAAANVVVVPLMHGAGVKFKTVEALLAGVPVVTTPIGAEGIGGPELFHGHTDDADTFAQAVASALLDPASAAQARASSSQKVLWAKYSTSDFGNKLRNIYR
ncbi:glycosyltransferase [Tessaracoccus lapidicaptus]|uniref:glycosyltransferase n=1 Tax=Tessaracoccus lapidicaptus TaxID=1427523 RepID=UPI00334160DC